MSRTKQQIKAAMNGNSAERAEKIASIIAPAEAQAESIARPYQHGDFVVCRVSHSYEDVRVGYVTGDGLMSFDGCILGGGAIITPLARPYRMSRSPDWRKVTFDGYDVITLDDGTEFRMANFDGSCHWTDGSGQKINVVEEAIRLTPA